jgi:ABC-type multidrug transport system permease subunit
VTGLTAMVTGISTLQGVGQVIASMRHGIWRTIRASLHPEWLYLAGLVASRIARTLLAVALLLLAAKLLFGFGLGGSLVGYFGIVLAGSVACACVGLCLAYVPPGPMSASTLMTVSVLCMTLVGGVFTSSAALVAPWTYVSPLTPIVRLLRSNVAGAAEPWAYTRDLLALVGWSAATGGAAIYLASRREDD